MVKHRGTLKRRRLRRTTGAWCRRGWRPGNGCTHCAVTSTTSIESDRESQPEKTEKAGPRRGTAHPACVVETVGYEKRQLSGAASFFMPGLLASRDSGLTRVVGSHVPVRCGSRVMHSGGGHTFSRAGGIIRVIASGGPDNGGSGCLGAEFSHDPCGGLACDGQVRVTGYALGREAYIHPGGVHNQGIGSGGGYV